MKYESLAQEIAKQYHLDCIELIIQLIKAIQEQIPGEEDRDILKHRVLDDIKEYQQEPRTTWSELMGASAKLVLFEKQPNGSKTLIEGFYIEEEN